MQKADVIVLTVVLHRAVISPRGQSMMRQPAGRECHTQGSTLHAEDDGEGLDEDSSHGTAPESKGVVSLHAVYLMWHSGIGWGQAVRLKCPT